jgi:putative 4-mercaptohistidine N1-methyltranferase
MTNIYETQEILSQYLLFHYGDEKDFQLHSGISKAFLNFPVRCVSECVELKGNRALDLGCAVGRSSFELSKYFNNVIGIDYSEKFIESANKIKNESKIKCSIKEQGSVFRELDLKLPEDVFANRVSFHKADAQCLDEQYYNNDLVLAANLLCRLPQPKEFLESTKKLVRSGGQLVLISPYSWLEDYTAKERWLSAKEPESLILEILKPEFNLIKKKELPFLIREHARKFQLGISQVLIFEKLK